MTPAWAGITLGFPALIGILAWEWSGPVGANRPVIDSPSVANVEPPRGIAPPTMDAGHGKDLASVILARPMFSVTRRPFVEGASPVLPSTKPPRLAGIVVSPNGRRAIFAGPSADGKAVAADEGERLGEYIILEISAEGVRVIGPDGAGQVVHLAADPARRAAGVAVLAANQPAQRARLRPLVLDLLRTIPGEIARLGPPGGPVPSQGAR